MVTKPQTACESVNYDIRCKGSRVFYSKIRLRVTLPNSDGKTRIVLSSVEFYGGLLRKTKKDEYNSVMDALKHGEFDSHSIPPPLYVFDRWSLNDEDTTESSIGNCSSFEELFDSDEKKNS